MIKLKCNWILSISLCFSPQIGFSQFIGSEVDTAEFLIEVRKGSIVEYSLFQDTNPGDEFRWEVSGGIITTLGATGTGTPVDPSVLDFTAGIHTIEIQWLFDDSTSLSFPATIKVQKLTPEHCASSILIQNVSQWSMPTASINEAYSGFSVCSGSDIGGYIVVDLTGASDFTFSYRISSNGLHDETGSGINTDFRDISTDNDTVHIMLPERLTNPSMAADKYYRIELLSMHDGFEGDGEIVAGRSEFTIIVFPSVKINVIESVKLNRR